MHRTVLFARSRRLRPVHVTAEQFFRLPLMRPVNLSRPSPITRRLTDATHRPHKSAANDHGPHLGSVNADHQSAGAPASARPPKPLTSRIESVMGRVGDGRFTSRAGKNRCLRRARALAPTIRQSATAAAAASPSGVVLGLIPVARAQTLVALVPTQAGLVLIPAARVRTPAALDRTLVAQDPTPAAIVPAPAANASHSSSRHP